MTSYFVSSCFDGISGIGYVKVGEKTIYTRIYNIIDKEELEYCTILYALWYIINFTDYKFSSVYTKNKAIVKELKNVYKEDTSKGYSTFIRSILKRYNINIVLDTGQ